MTVSYIAATSGPERHAVGTGNGRRPGDARDTKVYEDAADTSHLVLPPVSRLEEADLKHVAGGADENGMPS